MLFDKEPATRADIWSEPVVIGGVFLGAGAAGALITWVIKTAMQQ